MSDGLDEPPALIAGSLLLFASVPVLAFSSYRYGAWWSEIAVAGFLVASALVAVGFYQDRRREQNSDAVPDDPTDVLEDGDRE